MRFAKVANHVISKAQHDEACIESIVLGESAWQCICIANLFVKSPGLSMNSNFAFTEGLYQEAGDGQYASCVEQ